MSIDDIVTTKIYKSDASFIEKRSKLISEAVCFEGGTIDNQKKFLVDTFSDGYEAYFLKPGKETLFKTPNIHDMLPNVTFNGSSLTEKWAFEKLWEYLIKVSIIHQATFKKILVLLYRLCYLMDHEERPHGSVRFTPSNSLLYYIDSLQNFVLTDGFKDKFKTTEISLLGFLYFVDLLGWNEDVKYHTANGEPDFISRDKNIGRVNTIKSIISAPILISNFIIDIIQKTATNGVIDVSLITSTIQRFSISRGICVLSNKELLSNLEPYLEDN